MSSEREQIAAIRAQSLARIAELTAQPKPSYEVDGQRVAWAEYLARLQQTVDWCDGKLAAEAPIEVASRAAS